MHDVESEASMSKYKRYPSKSELEMANASQGVIGDCLTEYISQPAHWG